MIISMALALMAAQPAAVRQGLEPLQFLIGHCWQGRFPTGEVDTHCFDSVYDGQHIRDRHEVTGGRRRYRGETIYSWDGAANAVTYTYWNTSGGVSRGTVRVDGGQLNFGDETYRGPDGREFTLSTKWRRLEGNAYESQTISSNLPSMNRTVRFERVEARVETSEARSRDGTTTLIHETLVDAPVADVWTAVSTAEGWRTWAVPVAWSQEGSILETSYNPAAAPGDRSTIKQLILAKVPERMMAFRTIKAPDGFPHFDAFSRVTGVLELEPEGERRTRVRIVSAGYADDDAGRQLIGFFREGNRVSLDRLRRRFSEGPLDWNRERSAAQRSSE
jgi:uncharacterized protein YndB with AHSA1/START domain